MNSLTPVKAIKINVEHTIDGELIVEVDCADFKEYKKLPQVAKHTSGKLLVKTGWNSDRCYACYKQESNILMY